MLKTWREWWLNHNCLSVCVRECVRAPDEHCWPPLLSCSCTRCLQISLGGIRGACGRKSGVHTGCSGPHTHAHTHHPFTVHVLISASFPLHCSTNREQKNKKNRERFWLTLLSSELRFCSFYTVVHFVCNFEPAVTSLLRNWVFGGGLFQ